jgi:O-acetyl-ADP-ribose deacetylase (regulator of RNase III)
MSINFIKQDLTTSDADYICHQVNCQGAMNSGVAKAIREKWPIVFTTYYKVARTTLATDLLGTILTVDLNDYEPKGWPESPVVINMFSQKDYGYDGKRYTSYDAFWSCLGHIRETIPKESKISFPYRIGSDRGGANWDVIYTMIVAALGSDYDIEICYLNEDEWLLYHLDIGWEDK